MRKFAARSTRAHRGARLTAAAEGAAVLGERQLPQSLAYLAPLHVSGSARWPGVATPCCHSRRQIACSARGHANPPKPRACLTPTPTPRQAHCLTVCAGVCDARRPPAAYVVELVTFLQERRALNAVEKKMRDAMVRKGGAQQSGVLRWATREGVTHVARRSKCCGGWFSSLPSPSVAPSWRPTQVCTGRRCKPSTLQSAC